MITGAVPRSNAARPRRLPGATRRNCSKREMLNLLSIMKDLMPIGGDEWDEVLDRHSLRFPGREEVDSLRRKFGQLHRKSTPAGDPMCPAEVKLAKRIKYQISSRADIGDGTKEMDLVAGAFTNVDATFTNVNATFANVESAPGELADEEEEDKERRQDEVPGKLDAPGVPNGDLQVLANALETNVEEDSRDPRWRATMMSSAKSVLS
jgi:hypothetical protein